MFNFLNDSLLEFLLHYIIFFVMQLSFIFSLMCYNIFQCLLFKIIYYLSSYYISPFLYVDFIVYDALSNIFFHFFIIYFHF